MSIYTYPTLIPNYFTDLELPDFGVQVYEFDDGTESRRYVHESGNHTCVSLDYQGRSSNEVGTLISFYRQVKGLAYTFSLPADINQHPAAYVTAIANLGDTALWRFKEPPTIQTQFTNIYNFNVKLISVIQ